MTEILTRMIKALTVLIVASFSFVSCTISINGKAISVSSFFHKDALLEGVDTTVIYDVRRDFTEILSSGIYGIVYTDSVERVEVTCDKAFVSKLIVENQNDALVLGLKPDFFKKDGIISVLVPLSLRNLEEISLSGASRFSSEVVLGGHELEIELSGASKVTAEVEVSRLDLDISGASRACLSGVANNLNVDCSGSSRVDAADLCVKIAEVECSGVSNGEFTVERIQVNLSGASKVSINGDAEVKIKSSGSSRIERR